MKKGGGGGRRRRRVRRGLSGGCGPSRGDQEAVPTPEETQIKGPANQGPDGPVNAHESRAGPPAVGSGAAGSSDHEPFLLWFNMGGIRQRLEVPAERRLLKTAEVRNRYGYWYDTPPASRHPPARCPPDHEDDRLIDDIILVPRAGTGTRYQVRYRYPYLIII